MLDNSSMYSKERSKTITVLILYQEIKKNTTTTTTNENTGRTLWQIQLIYKEITPTTYFKNTFYIKF